MTSTPPAALSDVEEALVSALGDAVSTAPERLDAYVADTYWPALHAAAAGAPIARPEVVVRPRTEEEVADVVRIADEHGVRVVTPAGGLMETVGVPRHAVGPELTQLFVGSEGTLGVITRATLQLVPIPEERRFATV